MTDQHNPNSALMDPAIEYWDLWQSGLAPNVSEFVDDHKLSSPNQLGRILRFDLEFRLNTGEPISSHWYFREFPVLNENAEAAVDLIFAEYLTRRKLGEALDPGEFAAQFPRFSAEVRKQIDFHVALEDLTGEDAAGLVEGHHAETVWTNSIRTTSCAGPSNLGSSDSAGTVDFSHYSMVAEVGRGGMGVVYRALDNKLKRTVALKLLHAGTQAPVAQLRRFQSEAEAVARLRHPNIVQIFEIGQCDNEPYLAMEFVDGVNLSQFCGGQPQSPKLAARIVQKLAKAVHYAHQQGVLHRDLKPMNVLLANVPQPTAGGPPAEPNPADLDMEPMITDFGLAKMFHEEPDSAMSGVTCAGEILGTPCFMAPEQIDSSLETTPAADVYSLGAILYSLLTGRPPFLSTNPLKTMHQVLSEQPVAPSRLVPGLPIDLQTICLKCLEKDPTNRYASAQLLQQDLQRFLENRPVLARPVRVIQRTVRWCQRNKLFAGLAAALAVVCVIAGGIVFSMSSRASRISLESQQHFENSKRNLTRVLKTVDRFCLLVSQDNRLQRPEFNKLRQQLLQMAVEFDKEFVGMPDVAEDAKLQSAVAYIRLGSLGSGTDTLKESLQYLSLGREFLADLLESDPNNNEYALELVRCDRELGKIHSRLGDVGQAKEFLQSSIDQADQLLNRDPNLANAKLEKAKSLSSLGTLYLKGSQRIDAEKPLLESLELLEQLHKDLPDIWNIQIALANSYQKLGITYVSVIRYWKKAELPYQQAADIYQSALSAEPDSSDLAANLATTYHLQARWSYMANDLQRAITLLEQARDLLSAIAAKHENIFAYQAELSRTIRDLANYYSRVEALDPRVLELSEQAESLLSNLIAHDPFDTSYQSDMASTLLNHAVALKSHKQFQDALAKTDLAIQRSEGILELNRQDSLVLDNLHFAVEARADLDNEIGDFESALRDWDRAIEIAPPSFKVYDRMQRVRTLLLSGQVLNGTRIADSILAELDLSDSGAYQTIAVAAQVFALAAAKAQAEPLDSELQSLSTDFADKAMKLIQTRMDLAPLKAAYLETTRDFDGVRVRDDFNEILDKLRSTSDK